MKLPKTFLAVNLSDAFTFQEKPQGGDEAIEAEPEPEATPEAKPAKEGEPEAAKPDDAEANVALDTADAATVDDAATDEQSDVLEIKIPGDKCVHAVEADDDGTVESAAVSDTLEEAGVSPLPELEAAPPMSAVAPTTTEQQEKSKEEPENKA